VVLTLGGGRAATAQQVVAEADSEKAASAPGSLRGAGPPPPALCVSLAAHNAHPSQMVSPVNCAPIVLPSKAVGFPGTTVHVALRGALLSTRYLLCETPLPLQARLFLHADYFCDSTR